MDTTSLAVAKVSVIALMQPVFHQRCLAVYGDLMVAQAHVAGEQARSWKKYVPEQAWLVEFFRLLHQNLTH